MNIKATVKIFLDSISFYWKKLFNTPPTRPGAFIDERYLYLV